MKIVINAYSARQGGGQTYLVNLLSQLPATGTPLIEVFAPAGLKLPEHPNIKRVSANWPTENPLLRAAWERLVLPRYLRQTSADVLFCPGGLVATKAPRSCKVVTMFRNMIPFDPVAMNALPMGLQWIRSQMLKRLMLRSMREADLTIFISSFARGVIERLAKIPNPVTIPHGISETFRAQSAALPLPEAAGSQPYLLYVSKLDVYKHHREVVQAFGSLPQSLKQSHRLILIGEAEGAAVEQLRALIADQGLQGQVLLLGAVPYSQLPAFYQNAKAVLFASSCENCPNILLEALASGRPVLSSDVDPMPEFGGPGIGYFSPFDPDSIQRAMKSALESIEVQDRWARAALQQSQRYNWAETAKDTWGAIMRLGQVE
jgi:glycosyltransferase involved in cell wall biosynthesis